MSKFSKNQRLTEQPDVRLDSPGPGQYSTKVLKGEKNPEWKFSKSSRPGIKGDNPGPGSYNPAKQPQSNQKYSIGGKTLNDKMINLKSVDAPGPGAYNSSVVRQKTPQYSFGGKMKNYGGNSFSQNASQTQRFQTSNGNFGTQQRGDINQHSSMSQSVHGNPGDRNENGFNSARLQSSRLRPSTQGQLPATREMSTINKYHIGSPGPGNYESQNQSTIAKSKTQKIVFGTSQRGNHLIKNKEIPGPGNYNPDKSKDGPSYQFGVKHNQKGNDNPGPGSYQPIQSARTVTYKLGNEKRLNNQKSQSEIPGPGNYDGGLNLIGKGAPQIKIGGKSKRNDNTLGPGPGGYNSEVANIKQSNQVYKIGTEPRKTQFGAHTIGERESIPGPGNYDGGLNLIGKDAPQIQIGAKSKRNDNTLGPGPGGYNSELSNIKQSNQVYKIGTEPRKTQFGTHTNGEKESIPGPGNYDGGLNLIGKDAPQIQIGGKSKRNDNTLGPGPGGYNSEVSNIKQSNQVYKIGTEPRKTQFGTHTIGEKESIPGPGNYDGGLNLIGKDAPQIQIGGKSKRNDNTLGPGPGGYNSETSNIKQSNQVYKIGTEQRKTQFGTHTIGEKESIPGPGNYDGDLNLIGKGAPQIQIGAKFKRNDETLGPGPGGYNGQFSAVKNQNMSARIGSEERNPQFGNFDAKEQDKLPGPGMYNPLLPDGQSFKFNTTERKLDIKDTPGPGYYNP